MLETSARLLRLLSLFQGRRYWSGADLAERLEITPRTLRRDVDKLRSLGYPIHSSAGVEGGYQMGAGSAMPPLLLDDEEAVAVVLGLRSAATGAIQGMEEVSLRALAKLEQILPPRLGRRVTALQGMIVTPLSQPSIDARMLSTIASACRDQETLRFRYSDRAGDATLRSVEPHRLVYPGWRWYLVAWDQNRSDWRTFRIDRIQGRVTTGARFTPRKPPAEDLAAYVSGGEWPARPFRARVKLLANARLIAERMPRAHGIVEPIDEQSCHLETGSHSWESLAQHLVLLGVDFEVTDPPELVAEVRRTAERYRRATAPVSA